MSTSARDRSRRGPAAVVIGVSSLVIVVAGACVAPQPPSSKPSFTTTTAAKVAPPTTVATTIGTTPTSSSTTTSTSSSVPGGGTATVLPFAETVDYQPQGVNDADAPAIWVHASQPARSLVLGTLKEAGLDVYSPAGGLVQSIRPAAGHRFNNVAVVYDVTLNGVTRDLAVVTDRGTDKLHVYAIDGDATPPVVEVTAASVPLVFGTSGPVKSKTAYGIAAWRNPANGRGEVFVSQENTTNLARLELTAAAGGTISYLTTGTLSLPDTFILPGGTPWKPCVYPNHPDWGPHVEGMVIDPATGMLWADQEVVGVWRIGTNLSSPTLVRKLARFGQAWSGASGSCSVDTSSPSFGDAYLPGDVEGIALYRAGTGSDGYLLVSNQNSSSFVVLSRDGGAYRGTFKLGASGPLDKVEQTDGVTVTNVPLGPSAPQGLLVTQDGKNAPEGGTNFKLTSWPAVASKLGLAVDTAGDPRA
jgi:3-phytase